MELQIKEPLFSILQEYDRLDEFIFMVKKDDSFNLNEFNNMSAKDQICDTFLWHKDDTDLAKIADLVPDEE